MFFIFDSSVVTQGAETFIRNLISKLPGELRTNHKNKRMENSKTKMSPTELREIGPAFGLDWTCFFRSETKQLNEI